MKKILALLLSLLMLLSLAACGEKKDEVDHVYDEKKWAKDEDNHWHECACGAKSAEAKHAWDEGKVTTEPTNKQEGVKTFTCKDCAATKTEELPKVEAPKETTPAETTPTESTPKETTPKDEGNGNPQGGNHKG